MIRILQQDSLTLPKRSSLVDEEGKVEGFLQRSLFVDASFVKKVKSFNSSPRARKPGA
jgi:hypothetical protein